MYKWMKATSHCQDYLDNYLSINALVSYMNAVTISMGMGGSATADIAGSCHAHHTRR